MFKWERPTRLPCKYVLCSNYLTETIEADFHQWDAMCLERVVRAKTYLCLEHARKMEVAANMACEIWLTQEGWVYVTSLASPMDYPFRPE